MLRSLATIRIWSDVTGARGRGAYTAGMADDPSNPFTLARQKQVLIDYFVNRKYPQATVRGNVAASNARAYRGELEQKGLEELVASFEANKRMDDEYAAAKARAEEEARPFNQPSARADVAHWCKASYWTLEESVALLLDRAPEYVTWQSVQPHVTRSSFAIRFMRLRDLMLRAKVMGQLSDYMVPGMYLAWAKRNQQEVPERLESAIAAFGHQIGDWKTAYDSLKERTDKDAAERAKRQEQLAIELDDKAKKLARALADNDVLMQQASALKEKLEAPVPADRVLSRRERESLLKLVIGMATEGYRYNPAAARNPATKDIADDLARAGVPLDPDTVRHWLQEGAEILPAKPNERG